MENKLCEVQGTCAWQEEHCMEAGVEDSFVNGVQASLEDQSHWNFLTVEIVDA